MDVFTVRLRHTAIVWLVSFQAVWGTNYGLTSHSFTNLGDSRVHDKSVSPDYLESRLSFDEGTGLLVVVQNFGWTDDESLRIVEHYAWRAIDRTATLSDGDFDEKNTDYEFVAR